MNAWSITKHNVVIITTYDNETYELNYTLRQWNALVDQAEALGKKKIYLKKYDVNLYFSSVKKDKGRTLHKALPAPKKPLALSFMGSTERKQLQENNPDLYYKKEAEEAANRAKIKATAEKYRESTLENRRKNFLTERQEILKNLSKREKTLWFTTTLEKIEDSVKYKKLRIKNPNL